MMFSPITIVIVLCPFVSLTPSLHYFFFSAPVDRRGRSQGAADIISQVCSKKDIYSTSHLFLVGRNKEAGLVLLVRSGPCFLSGGKPNIYLGLSVCPPCFSSFALIELWHWCRLPIWLSLSVTSHCSCFTGFTNSGTSDWYMKPRIASTACPRGALFQP